MRALYRRVVPDSLRGFAWWVRNLFSHARSERLPVARTLNYDEYWQWRVAHHATAMAHPELVEICGEMFNAGTRVLDIGCGSGEFLAALRDQKGIQGIGIDTSAEAVRLARARGIDARVVDAGSDAIVPWEPINVVTIFEMIEHLPNPEQLLLNVQKLGCPVLVSIPNSGYVAARLRLALGRFPRQWVYHPAEHLRFWTLRDFELMASYLGYAIERLIPLKGERRFNRRFPDLFAEYLVFVLTPRCPDTAADESKPR